MARRSRSASASDVAEFARGRASSSDKREMGYVKKGGRLRPGPSTPARVRAAAKHGQKGGKARARVRRRKLN